MAAPANEIRSARASRWWLALFAVALVEVGGHVVEQSRVVPWSDWEAAGAHVRAEWRDGDAATAAPRWADPLMRAALGDRLDLRTAGRSDLEPFRRLWSLSIRGHRAEDAPAAAPSHVATFGRVRVERWDLPHAAVAYDLVEHVRDAEVARIENGAPIACRWQSGSRPTGGGLGQGPITPAERHVCDPHRPWLWVGATVEEDLDMLPRRCVWHHPQGEEPIRATWRDVPLGTRLVLHAGLWWEHERTMDGGPVDVVVRVGGEEVGRLRHEDGDGWEGIEAAIPEALRGARGTIELDVSSPAPHFRTLCWAASTREDPR